MNLLTKCALSASVVLGVMAGAVFVSSSSSTLQSAYAAEAFGAHFSGYKETAEEKAQFEKSTLHHAQVALNRIRQYLNAANQENKYTKEQAQALQQEVEQIDYNILNWQRNEPILKSLIEQMKEFARYIGIPDDFVGDPNYKHSYPPQLHENEVVNPSFKRISGETAYDTMQKLVQETFPSTCEYAVIASGEGYWDALSANGLAGNLNAPVLLTTHDALPAQTINELKRLHVSKVYVCGGTSVVSEAVCKQLKNLNISVERLAGETAADTANIIASKLPKTRMAFLATSWGYADALSVASYNYAFKKPLFLTNYSTGLVDDSTIKAMREAGVVSIDIVGGEGVIPVEAEQQLRDAGFWVYRYAGDDAYETSEHIGRQLERYGLKADAMGIATGWGYADALSAAAFCGKKHILIRLGDDTYIAQMRYNHPSASFATRTNYYIFGGTSVVSDDVENYIRNKVEKHNKYLTERAQRQAQR